ncbi:MAG: hypothetical protein OXB98_22255 [Bryobacterales bacterium]|nr:hypothetical protein [Bryobacterales bacterium]
MTQTASNLIDENTLTKMQLRKLNALRKSVGNEIGERAFAEWIRAQNVVEKTDKHADLITTALWPLIEEGKLTIPRGGYLVRRGRGRITVEPAEAKDYSPPPEDDAETVSSSSLSEPSSSAAGDPGAVEASVSDITIGDAPAAEASGEQGPHT